MSVCVSERERERERERDWRERERERERDRERDYRPESVDERAELFNADCLEITKVGPHLGVLGAGIFVEERDAVHLSLFVLSCP